MKSPFPSDVLKPPTGRALSDAARRAGPASGAALILALLASAPAHAALGENVASVESDRIQVRASVRQTSHAAFTVHELTTGMNGIVREYVSPSGRVFAVTWHGPTMPNLQQIMGTHFQTLAGAPHRVGARSHMAMQSNNLVFESSGHVRAFHGRAYLANAIPAGVTTNDIQ